MSSSSSATLPVAGGKIIGTPYTGTHAKAFNVKGGSDNWESENAVDIAVPIGTPVYATQDGTIGPQFGPTGEGGRFAGIRLHVNGASFSEYYAHLSSTAPGIRAGVTVKAGELLGYSGAANGVAHLHYATTTNMDPLALLKGLPGKVAGAVAGGTTGADTSATGPAGIPPALSSAGCATLLVRWCLYAVAVGPLLVLAVNAVIR